MDQKERREWLIRYLLNEQRPNQIAEIPVSEERQKELLRALMNIRRPGPIGNDFLKVQNEYLEAARNEKIITKLDDLTQKQSDIFLWRGDITTLEVEAIVNAANSYMTGCYQPCHNCIDNCIHTYAGVQLRNECDEIMQKQGHEEETGQAKITLGYNLPCRYVLHTVGPIVQGGLSNKHREQLRSCYESCLELASQHDILSLAFCCISTGVFMFPKEEAAKIAVDTVLKYKQQTGSNIKVVFTVFDDEDEKIYDKLLS